MREFMRVRLLERTNPSRTRIPESEVGVRSLEGADSGLRAPDSGLLTPGSGFLALGSGRLAPEFGLLTPDSGLLTPGLRLWAPDSWLATRDWRRRTQRGATRLSNESLLPIYLWQPSTVAKGKWEPR